MKRKSFRARNLNRTIRKTKLRPILVASILAIVCAIAISLFLPRQQVIIVDPPAPNPPESVGQGKDNISVPESLSQTNNSLSKYKVVKVVDGDTIDVEMGTETERVRLIGVDTPETVHPSKPVECYGPDASNYTKSKLLGEYVAIEFDDSQGMRDNTEQHRLLAYVYLDGKNFNYDLIYNGYARESTYNIPYAYQKEFKQAENYASENKSGLWNPMTCPQA